jgi:diphthine-ammonia ligase
MMKGLWICCSGGKDSCYNALLCERYGHTVVALGNLYPDDPDVDELDSYMY